MPTVGRRKIIIDVGAESGTFAKLLRERNPSKKVLAIDENPSGKGVIRQSLGEFSVEIREPQTRRFHAVWINHVNLRTTQGNKELRELARKIPPQTPIFFTVRRENLEATKFSIESAGLVVKSEIAYNPKMLGSETTRRYYEMAKAQPQYAPIRLVAVKQAPKDK